MPLTLQDLALDGSFAGVARRLAAGEDPTVVEPRYAHLWIDPARYPTAITLVTPPSLDATGLMIVPFLDGIGEPGDEAFNLYAGVVYILDVHGVVLRSREYQDAPGEASLLTYAPGRRRRRPHRPLWQMCEAVPYDDPAFRLAVRLLRVAADDWKTTRRPSALSALLTLVVGRPTWPPSLATLTRVVTPVRRSWTKMSSPPLVSSGTRFVAWDMKATTRPSALIAGLMLPRKVASAAWLPSLATLTRVVTPVRRSWTKMSSAILVSPATRLKAPDCSATPPRR
jgi:hypothetical protein